MAVNFDALTDAVLGAFGDAGADGSPIFAQYVPKTGVAFGLRVVFDRHQTSVEIDRDGAPVTVRRTAALARLSEGFPAGFEYEEGDQLVRDGETFDVVDFKPDGFGAAHLVLGKAP